MSTAAAEDKQQYKPILNSQQLNDKANRLQSLVEEKIVQDHGLIPMFVRASDYKLPTAEDYKGAYRHRHLKGKTEKQIGMPPMHVWRAWEDTATITAYYLAAMSYKYRCTGDPKDLAICRRTLKALQFIFSLTAEKGEKGRLCKPYGGSWSNQSSPDQAQCVLWGLAAYREIAPPEDLAAINTIIKDAAAYNIKTEYCSPYGYFATPRLGGWKFASNWVYAMIFLPQLNLAWRATGDTKFLSEIQRWYDACGLDKPKKGWAARRDLRMGALLMEMAPSHHDIWRRMMHDSFKKNTSNILPDGTSSDCAGRSAVVAMGCATAQRWFPDEDMTSVARHILEKLDEGTFRFVRHGTKPSWASEGDTVEQWEVETKMIDCVSLSAWLAAYWEGRWRGYW